MPTSMPDVRPSAAGKRSLFGGMKAKPATTAATAGTAGGGGSSAQPRPSAAPLPEQSKSHAAQMGGGATQRMTLLKAQHAKPSASHPNISHERSAAPVGAAPVAKPTSAGADAGDGRSGGGSILLPRGAGEGGGRKVCMCACICLFSDS